MESSIWKKAGRFLREQGKNKRWRKILTVLGAVVVFVTAYILLMPAVAIERKNICELDEHTHTDECYGQILTCGKVGVGDETEEPITLEYCCTFLEELHTHTEECYDQENHIVCGYADYAVHKHNSNCYEGGSLVCALPEIEEHEHTKACYRINDSGYICGQEEAEAHTHTDACYTDYRELSCEEAEREGHTHSDACYTREWEVVCGREESEGHAHTDSCYGEDGTLICGQEESEGHKHDETACYEMTEKLICGRIESKGHEHDASCYTVRHELTCEKEENPNGHKHTEACRGVVEELVCGKDEVIVHSHTVEDGCYEAVMDDAGNQLRDENGDLLWTLVCEQPEVEEHVHGEECYREHEHTEECYEEGLICGKEEHVHTEECIGKEEALFYCAGRIHAHTEDCYDSEGNIACGYGDFVVHTHDQACHDPEGTLICPLPEIGEHAHTEECYNSEGSLVCELPEVSLHTHTEVCYDAEGTLNCGKMEVREHHHSDACRSPEVMEEEADEQLFTKTCEGDGYIVTVSYRADANIPEEAELLAEQITQEENEAHYAERQAQFQKTLKDEGATIRALLKIGFYLNGEEIEPESDVTVTVQLLDENGLAEGGPVTVVHFAKDETEVLDGSDVKDSSTTFQMGSFSEIAIGYRTGEEESAGIYVSQMFMYEDDAVQITFHIEGNAQPLDRSEKLFPEKNDGEEQTEEAIGEEETLEKNPQPEEPEEFQKDEEEQAETEDKDSAGENDVTVETEPEDAKPERNKSFEFKIDPIEKNTEEYKAFLAYEEQNGGAEELIRMKVLSYALFYDGIELDLTNCQVKAEITTASKLREQVGRSIPEAVSYLRSHEGDTVRVEGNTLEQGNPKEDDRQPEQQTDAASNMQGEEPTADERDINGKSAEETHAKEPFEDSAEEPQENENASAEDQEKQEEQVLGNETGLVLTVMEQSDSVEMNELANIVYEEAGTPADESLEFTLNQPMFAVKASNTANPAFTVQYYANLDILNKVATPGSEGLPVIDTTGGKLPENGRGKDNSPNGNAIKNIYVDSNGTVLRTKALTEVYRSRQYRYIDAPTINYFDALIERKDNYKLVEIWVSRVMHSDSCYKIDEETGEKELICKHTELESTDPSNWDIYYYSPELHFTNREVSETASPGGNSGYIYIAQDATIRLVYDVTTGSSDASANFYDYDISDGWIYSSQADANGQKNGKPTSQQNDNSKWFLHTQESGINAPDNYDKKAPSTDAKLAFGNANAGTQLGTTQKWGEAEYELNKRNDISYKLCTFGLVTGLDGDGNIQYADGVNAPNLFNDGKAAGKTSYDNYTLQFNRSGDTYTLNAVNKGNKTAAGNLANFSHPGKYSIWTNHFWPMDTADSWGTDGHDPLSGSTVNADNRNFAKEEANNNFGKLPISDDGNNHNAYFGMSYEVDFELSEDYIGPLEYCFYGDDDMWVFLNGQLVCDIGGVHSSVGEYVNLWDHISEQRKAELCSHEADTCRDENGNLICTKNKFKLNVFYTERGASGSTCWMEFTLPSASVKGLTTTDVDYGRLRVDKRVAATSNLNGEEVEWDSGDEFEFEIKFTGSDGNKLPDDYSYCKYDKNGNKVGSDLIVWDGGTFTLKNGEYIVVQYLPQGTKYTVTEKNSAIKYKEKKDENGNPIYDEDGNPVLEPDGESDYYYFTGIVVDGEEQGENLTENKVASGSIPKADESSVQYTNRVILYELPESGGSGTNLYTMAGISFLLMAGLMYRKKFRERRAGSSRN